MGPGVEHESGQDVEPDPGLERRLEKMPETWDGGSEGSGDWGVLLLPLGLEPMLANCREPSLELELLSVRESLRWLALCLVLGPSARVPSELQLMSLQT